MQSGIFTYYDDGNSDYVHVRDCDCVHVSDHSVVVVVLIPRWAWDWSYRSCDGRHIRHQKHLPRNSVHFPHPARPPRRHRPRRRPRQTYCLHAGWPWCWPALSRCWWLLWSWTRSCLSCTGSRPGDPSKKLRTVAVGAAAVGQAAAAGAMGSCAILERRHLKWRLHYYC